MTARKVADTWGTIQVSLRLPDVPAYVPGRVSRTTGRANYSTRLRMSEAWAEEVRTYEMAHRSTAKPRFAGRVLKSEGTWW